MKQLLTIGKIINVRGLQGEVKVASLTDFALLRYRKGNTVYLDEHGDKPLVVKSHHQAKGFDYVQFEGYPTIESVTPLIQQFLYAEKSAIRLSQHTYFHRDLEGCKLVDEQGTTLGKVDKVETYGTRTLLRMKRVEKADVLIPFIAPFILRVNLEQKEITVALIEGML